MVALSPARAGSTLACDACQLFELAAATHCVWNSVAARWTRVRYVQESRLIGIAASDGRCAGRLRTASQTNGDATTRTIAPRAPANSSARRPSRRSHDWSDTNEDYDSATRSDRAARSECPREPLRRAPIGSYGAGDSADELRRVGAYELPERGANAGQFIVESAEGRARLVSQ
jgi:hypothetical protein